MFALLAYFSLTTWLCALASDGNDHYSENLENNLRLDWTLHRHERYIDFQYCLCNQPSPAVIGLGFSDRGDIQHADLVVAYETAFGEWKVQDEHTDSRAILRLDTNNNLLSAETRLTQDGEELCLTFSRAWSTGDPWDYSIDTGTTHLIYFSSPLPYTVLRKLPLTMTNWKSRPLQIIKSPLAIHTLPPGVHYLDFTVSQVTIPAVETTYWCMSLAMPQLKQKQHIVGYEGIISPESQGIVHHLEVFHCDLPPDQVVRSYNAPCNSETKPMGLGECRQVIGAWAMGAKGLIYPPQAGYPIGGEDFSPYFVIEVHYNNQQRRGDVVDSSGLRLYLTDHMRPFDVGIMELGLAYDSRNSIPPGQRSFQLAGFCSEHCTEKALPAEGIVVFGSQLHTHLTGIEVATLHYRHNRQLPDLNRDRHYSPHYQEIRHLQHYVHVLPGDTLINVCSYDTRNRSTVTLGGIAITNEMCLNYIFYYPKIDLELCKSIASEEQMQDYFRSVAGSKRRRRRHNPATEEQSVDKAFLDVNWTNSAASVQKLQSIYLHGRIDMSCNASNGQELLKRWRNVPIDSYLTNIQ